MSQDAIGVSVEASVRAFGVDQEISFRLCLYIINFFKSGEDRYSEFKKFRQSYDDRSRVAHGAATKAKAVHEHATHARDILPACLVNVLKPTRFQIRGS